MVQNYSKTYTVYGSQFDNHEQAQPTRLCGRLHRQVSIVASACQARTTSGFQLKHCRSSQAELPPFIRAWEFSRFDTQAGDHFIVMIDSTNVADKMLAF